MSMRILCLVLISGLVLACQPENDQGPGKFQGPSPNAALQSQPDPPAPPLLEDFESEPKLSLFPRIGDYRPEASDQLRLPFYNAYLEHLVRSAGVVELPGEGHAFRMRSVARLDSVGFFSPIAVQPDTAYRISACFKTELPEDGRAGIGILEFDQFLWVSEQYPRSLAERHQTGMQEGLEISGVHDWQPQSFEIITGINTRMIHLVFYREGTDHRAPVLFDDVKIVRIR
jgi:hypothetical protein